MLGLFTEVLLPNVTGINKPDISSPCTILDICFVELKKVYSCNCFAFSPNNSSLGLVSACANRGEPSTVCVPERVWCVGALVQGSSVPWCRLEQGSHVDTAARPICASHTVTITELLTLEALSSHIAVKPLTMPHTPIPKPRSCSPAAQLPALAFTAVD